MYTSGSRVISLSFPFLLETSINFFPNKILQPFPCCFITAWFSNLVETNREKCVDFWQYFYLQIATDIIPSKNNWIHWQKSIMVTFICMISSHLLEIGHLFQKSSCFELNGTTKNSTALSLLNYLFLQEITHLCALNKLCSTRNTYSYTKRERDYHYYYYLNVPFIVNRFVRKSWFLLFPLSLWLLLVVVSNNPWEE